MLSWLECTQTPYILGESRNGNDFVVISAEDWEREQETLYVLQNASLVQQIAQSTQTHSQNQGYSPTTEEVDEILNI